MRYTSKRAKYPQRIKHCFLKLSQNNNKHPLQHIGTQEDESLCEQVLTVTRGHFRFKPPSAILTLEVLVSLGSAESIAPGPSG